MPCPMIAAVGTTGTPSRARELLRVHVNAALLGFVHLVQRDHQRAPEFHELQRQLEMMFERRGVEHLHDDVRRRKRRGRTVRLVQRNRRALVAPQQVFQRRAVFRIQIVRRADARQIDHARFIEPDLHGAFVVDAGCVPASAPVLTDVLATDAKNVLLPLLGKPTSAMRSRRLPR